MEETSGQTGIEWHGIYLDELEYQVDIKDKSASLCSKVDIEIGVQFRNEDPNGYVRLNVDCVHPENEPNGHRLHVRVVGVYERISENPSVKFDEYLAVNAPASLFAFAREIVYSVTSRSYLAPILLNPVKMIDVLREGKLRYSQEIAKPIEASRLE